MADVAGFINAQLEQYGLEGSLDEAPRYLGAVGIAYLMFWVCWFWIHIDCFAFMLYSKDNKWTKHTPPTASQVKNAGKAVDEVKLIFVRHGESTWNETFNKSKFPPFFIYRLLSSAFKEIMLIISGVQDSWFIDSPLNKKGFKQADELRAFLDKNKGDPNVGHECKEILGIAENKSTMVASNLRRAISTGVAGAWERIKRKGDKIMIHSGLQEISRNPDTMAITPAFTVPVPSWMDKKNKAVNMVDGYKKALKAEHHTGNKSMTGNGQQRMLSFLEWAFATPEQGTLVCFGHSLYFKNFFKEFLPQSSTHDAKSRKMHNCAVVSLTVKRLMSQGQPSYLVDESSIKVVYLGFEGKKSKK